MESVAEQVEQAACDACQNPYTVSGHADNLCPGCSAVFRAARTLLKHGVVREEEMIPTLVFARIAGRARDPRYADYYGSRVGTAEEDVLAGEHPALDVARWLDKVPVVQVRPLAVTAEKHPGTQVLKRVRIRTLSKHARSADVASSYEQLLEEEGAQWGENNHGGFSYDCLYGYLELVVAEGSELSKTVEIHGESRFREGLFCHPALHFPPPGVVEGVHEALKTRFADRLDLYGKGWPKTPSTLIPAFAAWHIAARADEKVPPASRARASQILNKYLLEPSGLLPLPESTWTSNNTVWRDVAQLWPRFVTLQQYAFFASHCA